jgi:FkbM family methyltransferase
VILKYIKEILRIYCETLNHPLNRSITHKNILKKLWRWYIINGISNKEVSIPFVNKTKLLLKRKVSGREYYFYTLPEFHDMLLVARLMRGNSNLIDVGANIGSYSVIAASSYAESAIVAFEPSSQAFSLLSKNIANNNLEKQVTIHNLAVGDTNSTVSISKRRGAENQIINSKNNNTQWAVEKVPQITLDSCIKHVSKFSVLKIDVEGYEHAVLLGANKLLRNENMQIVILETCGHSVHFEKNEDIIFKLLNNYGFTPYYYDAYSNKLTPQYGKSGRSTNTVFVKNLELIMSKITISNISIQKELSLD